MLEYSTSRDVAGWRSEGGRNLRCEQESHGLEVRSKHSMKVCSGVLRLQPCSVVDSSDLHRQSTR